MKLPKPEVLCTNRYDFAHDVLKKTVLKGSSLYDIGAGLAPMKEKAEALGLRWSGFDLTPQRADIAVWNLDHPFPNENSMCDAIIMLDVVEHLKNLGSAMHNIRKVLRNKGILIISTPNPRWSKSRLFALKTGNLACFTEKDLDLNHHIFPVWPHVMCKILHDEGFVMTNYYLLEGPTAYWPKVSFSFSYILKILANLGTRLIEKLDPSACGMSYGIVAQLSK